MALRDLRDNFRGAFPTGSITPTGRPTSTRCAGRADVDEAATSRSRPDPPSYSRDDPDAASRRRRRPASRLPCDHYRRSRSARRRAVKIRTGSVVIAAITSCTNTSNPTVMVAAGLLARNAVARGLTTKPWVKTSLAPGSRAVTDYLDGAGLMDPLEALGFHLVGYGCTTCIGNSGPLAEPVAEADRGERPRARSPVLSGNRNFEGRIHPLARASYLASPPLVVAFALAGRIDIDLDQRADRDRLRRRAGYAGDIWPSAAEVAEVVPKRCQRATSSAQLRVGLRRRRPMAGLPVPAGDRYAWDPASTYVARPPFFDGLAR